MKKTILMAFAFLFVFANQNLDKKANEYFKEKQYKKAFEIWSKLAKSGDVKAKNNIAIMYYKGLGVDYKQSEAVELLKQIIKDTNNSEAMYNLGYIYVIGYYDEINHTIVKDKKKGLNLIKKAAQLGNKKAIKLLELVNKKNKEINATKKK